MKRIIILITAIMVSAMACSADGRKEVVTVKDLPAAGQQFLSSHFADNAVSYVIKERELTGTEYEVKFQNGVEIDFDGDGIWKKIDCGRAPVPEAVIPPEILTKINQSFPGNSAVEIKKEWRGYEVELSNGFDLEFNKKGKFLRMDD